MTVGAPLNEPDAGRLPQYYWPAVSRGGSNPPAATPLLPDSLNPRLLRRFGGPSRVPVPHAPGSGDLNATKRVTSDYSQWHILRNRRGAAEYGREADVRGAAVAVRDGAGSPDLLQMVVVTSDRPRSGQDGTNGLLTQNVLLWVVESTYLSEN